MRPLPTALALSLILLASCTQAPPPESDPIVPATLPLAAADTLDVPPPSDSILWPAVEEPEAPTEETLLAKILRGHPPLADLQELYTHGAQAYLDGNLDLAEEHFFLLRESLEASEDAPSPPDSLAVLYLGSLERKLDRFVGIVTEERFFSESYAPITQTLTAAFDSLRIHTGIPEFLVTVSAEDATSLQGELLSLENDRIGKWMDYFTESPSGRRHFQIWLDRYARVGPVIEEILEEEGLPRELVFLSMIESGLQPSVRSRASAVGYWQFIRSTARNRGLAVNDWVDERRDLLKSTRAACRHLQMLHGMFGRWSLALAAYNAGEYRIQRAIGLQGDPDYWHLRLPRETRDYVPKFIAAARVGSDPEKYGFTAPTPDPIRFDIVELDDAYSLEQLAKVDGVSERRLRELNPQLLASCTPPRVEDYQLRVPPGTGEAVAAAAASIPEDQRLSWQKHRVQKGETLGALARRYRTSVSAIMDLNGISNARRVRAGRVLTIPFPRGAAPVAVASARTNDSGAYVVRRGDTLIGIAKRHGTTVGALRSANNLRGNRIVAGKSLVIPGHTSTPGTMPSEDTHEQTRYRIVRGDTLTAIAGRFGVTVPDLLFWNKLPRNGRIRAGEELSIWKPRVSVTR